MRYVITFLSLSLLLFITAGRASAQYYDWGAEPFTVRWMQAGKGRQKIVFPADYSRQAFRMIHYMDTVRRPAGYGFRHGAMPVQVLIHARNFASNGIVMMAPNRMELLAIPPVSTYATVWMKQLIAHETRHAVQYNNLNRNVIRVLGNVFGQHGSIIGLAFMPLWAMEGDAVMFETQATAFGRALQPSFTIDYRAMALEGVREFRPDKYFSGSYKDYVPDHYHIGYQIAAHAWDKYGENVWDKVADYGSRRPYQLFTTHIALKKYYGTSTTKLLRETMAGLKEYWQSLPLEENSSEIIPTTTTSYTTYRWPIEIDDSTVVALKEDLDRTQRIVMVDKGTGREKVLHRTGYVNSPLTYGGGMLYWSEERGSMLFEQKVNSVVCWYDLRRGRAGVNRWGRTQLFPVAMGEGGYASVDYHYDGKYVIRYGGWHLQLPDSISVHGLAADGRDFYFKPEVQSAK